MLLLGDPDCGAGRAALVAVDRFHTTARRISVVRRQLVESAKSAPKEAFADLSRGSSASWASSRRRAPLGFTLAAYNLDRIGSFKAKHGVDDDSQVAERPKHGRARRYSGT